MTEFKPIFFKKNQIRALKNKNSCLIEVDAFSRQIRELFFIENPQYKNESPEVKILLSKYLKNNSNLKPEWIYFPWLNTIVKNTPEDIYYKLRTARNKDVITEAEQRNYRNITVGVVGLSVGSKILSALVQSGGPKKIKIADFDNIEVTNLNRIQANLTDIGTNKVLVAAKETWKLDPHAKIELWQNGVNNKNIEKFMVGKSKLDFFVDEMDDIPLKILSRFIARKNRIPTIMATDNGDSVILDIERYDLEPKRQIFHNLLGNIGIKDTKKLSHKEWLEIAMKIVGPQYLSSSMQCSLLNIGKTIASIPQLGTTASIAGAAVSYAIREIANKKDLPSGRYVLNLEEKISSDYYSVKKKTEREEDLNAFIKNFGK